ncbi:DUF4344 domain-containing metallopeptidase [Mycolicibacterium hodleri]|uniref:DUF4344 domain-containing metallopeptidase n=1 Tax=Mycolicibacterium hodleri TaxID=49897 RepID=UPI0021F3BFA1|nr:DUF4344 domain-containing metallopeptidase [Mycolicibacterium hodleri]
MEIGFRTGMVVAALVAVVSGCGEQHPAATSPASGKTAGVAAPTPTQTDVNRNGVPDADPSDEDWPGKMTVVYEDATTPDAVRGRRFMEDTKLLPQLAEDITGSLKLPYDIPLKGSQCDEPNDFWSPADKEMTLCYEDVANSLDLFTKLGDEDPEASAFHEALASFYHETGHMVIDLYELPATGREEDAADQASAYLLLQRDDDGRFDPESVQAIMDSGRWFGAMSSGAGGEIDDDQLADVHSPDRARMFNMVCWAYGADPDDTGDVVAAGLLPAARADLCEDEYRKLDRAWSTLLTPYVK